MSINPVGSAAAANPVSSLKSVSRPNDPDEVAATPGISVQMSPMGGLMNELTSLAQSDPDKFKQVTAQISQQLTDAAAQQSGHAADFLTKMADRFKQASQSGNASDLSPQGHHGPHQAGGHHAHKQYAQADDPTGQSTDPNNSRAAVMKSVEDIISQALQATTAATATL